jgi:Sulfatase
MNQLKKNPFFLLLLPVFFCLHGGLENFGVIYFSEALLTGIYISLSLALLFLLLLWITGNRTDASLICFYAGLYYLFFGALQDWLNEIKWLSFLNRYTVLIPFLLLSITGLVFFFRKKKQVRPRLFLYLNVLLILYCGVDAALLLRKSFIYSKDSLSDIAFDLSKVKAKPNVYYLLFDGYPGYASLQSQFGYKNDSLYSFLQNRGFKILPSISNYNFTIFSMSSIFNMKYVDNNYEHEHQLRDQQDFRNRFIEIKKAEIFAIYESMGYRFQNLSIFDMGKQGCINPDISFLPVHTRVLTSKMLHKRFIRHTGWWFKGTKLQDALTFKEPLFQTDTTNRYIEIMLKQGLAKKKDHPTFCYAHLVMPHSPYFRDSTGAPINKEGQLPWKNENDTRYFLPYLKYTNSVITSITNEIVGKDPGAIVVIMSDHGFRNYEYQKKYYPAAFDNICAVRFPGNDTIPFGNSKSGVNFFRYLFNSQYGQQILYLKDSTVWINY